MKTAYLRYAIQRCCCCITGGTGTIGYKIDEDKFYHLDPLTAPLVLEAFQQYDNGERMVEIVNFLNDKGVRNMQDGKMTHSSVNTMLKNRRYIGELSFRDIVVPDAIPAIVPKDLFDRVQKRMDKNKRAPACGKADEEYLLDHQAVLRQMRCADVRRKRNQCHRAHLLLL